MAEPGTDPSRSPEARAERPADDAEAGRAPLGPVHFGQADLGDAKVGLAQMGGSAGVVSVRRVTKGVGQAIGRTLRVERDAALPDHLSSLVDRLQAGPLGRTSLKTHRVA